MELIIVLLVVILIVCILNIIVVFRLLSSIKNIEQKLELIPRRSAELLNSKYFKQNKNIEPALQAQRKIVEQNKPEAAKEKPKIFEPLNKNQIIDEVETKTDEEKENINEVQKKKEFDISEKKFDKYSVPANIPIDNLKHKDDYQWR